MLYNFVLHYDGSTLYYNTKDSAYNAFEHYALGGFNSVALFRRGGEILARHEFGETVYYVNKI